MKYLLIEYAVWNAATLSMGYVHKRSFELPLLSEVGVSVSGLRLVIRIH